MFKKITRAVGLGLAGFALMVGLTPSASAANLSVGNKIYNSGASDNAIYIFPNGGNDYDAPDTVLLRPGYYYTLQSGNFSPANLRVGIIIADSFRVRYNASSGAYQGCQNIPDDGKNFHPANERRIDILTYFDSNCVH